MSSTNKTTNYELSQFTQTDKPAWLGDYNLDMSKIDSALHTNAGNISTNTTNIATNTENISVNAGAISSLEDDVDDLDSRVDVLEAELDLSNISTFDASTLGTDFTGSVTLAQNTNGTFFKAYGNVEMTNATTSTVNYTKTQIPGLLVNNNACYGFKTTLKTNKNPQSAFIISNSGTFAQRNDENNYIVYIRATDFAIGTDGYIYLRFGTGGWNTQTAQIGSTRTFRYNYDPCLYINKDFGDTPSPSA